MTTFAALYEQGMLANADGNTRGALRCFLRALSLAPECAACTISAANMHKKLREHGEARVLYRRAQVLELTGPQRVMVDGKLEEIDKSEREERARNQVNAPSATVEHAANAAQAYKRGMDKDLAPALREIRLNEAIRLWNGLLANGLPSHSSTLHKNLGCAHQLLCDLSIESETGVVFRLAPTLRAHHARESMQSFTASFRAGQAEDRPDLWLDEVLARGQSAFMSLASLMRSSPLNDKCLLRNTAIRLPEAVQATAMLEVIDVLYAHGVAALDRGEWSEALKAFREVERPIEEAQLLLRRTRLLLQQCCRGSTHAELQERRELVLTHMYIAESRLAIKIGDALVNAALRGSEALDIEQVWTGIDKYQEAGVLTRGRDIETEAVALARRGRVYAKVLRNETLARPLLHQATTLAASLAPRSFHGIPWYDECIRQLQEYQKRAAEADERAANREREAELKKQESTRRALKSELEALKSYAEAHNAYQLLEHVYAKYEPKIDMYKRQAEAIQRQVKAADAATLKKVLRQALTHYHPDKNADFGDEWKVRCEEVFKYLNNRYDTAKSE